MQTTVLLRSQECYFAVNWKTYSHCRHSGPLVIKIFPSALLQCSMNFTCRGDIVYIYIYIYRFGLCTPWSIVFCILTPFLFSQTLHLTTLEPIFLLFTSEKGRPALAYQVTVGLGALLLLRLGKAVQLGKGDPKANNRVRDSCSFMIKVFERDRDTRWHT